MADEDKVYPRTGKRGVPQQFPRKLYEMLEFESGSFSVDWVANGRGFCIKNVKHFSEIVLPKWFKTCKFSSFQRNLNLYGFTKSRKGSNTMYCHPLFYKGNIDGLSTIRKRGPSKNKKNKVQDDMHVNANRVGTTANAKATTIHKSSFVDVNTVTSFRKDSSMEIQSGNSSPRPGGRLELLTEVMKIVIQDDSSWSSDLYSAGSRGYFSNNVYD